jgi:transmembrane sensor
MTESSSPSPTPSSLDFDKLGRFLAGESSPEEAAEMRRWLAEHPHDAKFVEALDAAKLMAMDKSLDVDAALRRVKQRARTRSPVRLVTFAAAAVVLLVAGAIVVSEKVTTFRGNVYTSGVGQRDSVVLADGSRVLLGPASRLVVRRNGREVSLVGEAFFSVFHDDRRPFTVRAGDAVIRDIGTEFSVHNDSAESSLVRVVVREGAVALTHAADSVTLRRGDVGIVDTGGAVRANRGAATDDDLAWTRGRLVFRNAPMPELSADLRRWYGVELRVTDTALLSRHFTGSFDGEPADRVLDVIALALGARLERRADTAYLRTALPVK